MLALKDSLIELKEARERLLSRPSDENAVRAFAEVHGAIKAMEELGFKDEVEESPEVEELEEHLEAVENYFTSYMDKKREYQLDKTDLNRDAMIEKLKLVLLDMQEACSEIWSAADTAEEKQFISQFGAKVFNMTR